MFSSSIHLPVNVKISFFLVAEQNSVVYKYYIFLILSLVVEYLGHFHSLAIMNDAEISMDMQVSL
jgi:hypothetical protein